MAFFDIGDTEKVAFDDTEKVALSLLCCAVRGGTYIQGGACGGVVGCVILCRCPAPLSWMSCAFVLDVVIGFGGFVDAVSVH